MYDGDVLVFRYGLSEFSRSAAAASENFSKIIALLLSIIIYY